MKRVLFLTGTRADFGKLKPLIRTVRAEDEFEVVIFATGMHMLSRYGSTINEIYKSGFDNVFTFINQDATGLGMDLTLANTVQGLGLYVREFPPDLIVVHGDRLEALAGAIVGAFNNILVAHVEGGEISGTIDELIRHSVSKLAHLHFVSNEEARTRLLQMGELPEAVHAIGSPEVDLMLSDELPALAEVRERYEIPFEDYAIFAYHPVTTELDALPKRVDAIMDGIRQSGENYVVIYPNNDEGSDVIFRGIETLRGEPNVRLIPSMRFEHYLTLLRNARFIMGNSSSSVREAPVYGVPTINLGSRQSNRSNSPSIFNVEESTPAILDAIRSLPGHIAPSLQFGRGDSADRFVDVLLADDTWEILRQKQFKDLAVAEA